jgi:hypothetical protein
VRGPRGAADSGDVQSDADDIARISNGFVLLMNRLTIVRASTLAALKDARTTRSGAVYFHRAPLTLGTRTTEAQGWKRRSLTTNCGY